MSMLIEGKMMKGADILSQGRLAQDKARYDADKEMERQELLTTQKIMVKGIDIPFWDLVRILVNIAFASIPAGIIVATTWYYIWKYIIALIGKF